jgi:transcriptional regulator with XRE-family HTH domain
VAYNRYEMKAARTRRNLRQADIADMLGIVPVVYSRKETGAGKFSLAEVDKLRKDMGLTDAEIKQIFFAN